MGQAHVGAPQQAVEGIAGEAVRQRRGLQEVAIDAAVRVALA
ncbi:hypothetical protein P308_17450 [Pseudomonas piscis]|nr:hypothetical protein P308_17450 [Pseudomonas piscis]